MKIQRKNSSAWVVGVLLASLVITSGCSLLNPHVTWERPDKGQPVTLQSAIEYANRAKDEYKNAVGDQALLTNGIGLTLIPLSAAAIGLGISGVDGNAITALGLTGATAYGVSTWLSSKPRQLVYLAGVKAMTCAVEAMLPLNLSTTTRTNLSNSLSGAGTAESPSLNIGIGFVERDLAEVQRLIDEVIQVAPGEKALIALIARAGISVSAAEALLATARSALTAGTKLDLELSSAGQTLANAVDRIGAEVDKALVATVPEIQALSAIIGSLAQVSAQFTKLPETTKGVPGKSEKVEKALDKMRPRAAVAAPTELNNELDILKESSRKLGNSTRRVAAIVNAVSEAPRAEALKDCGVEEVATGLTVRPAGPIEFDEGKGGTRRLLITGGKSPYGAKLLERPVVGLIVPPPEPFVLHPEVVIQATDKAPVGKYTVSVTDAAGHNQMVIVNVKPKTP